MISSDTTWMPCNLAFTLGKATAFPATHTNRPPQIGALGGGGFVYAENVFTPPPRHHAAYLHGPWVTYVCVSPKGTSSGPPTTL